MTESHLRSVAKGISWRIIGTIDTMIISYFVTGTQVRFIHNRMSTKKRERLIEIQARKKFSPEENKT